MSSVDRLGTAADVTSIIDHLHARGVLSDKEATVHQLSGGVSNDVLAVHGRDGSFVVKRALRRLRVAEEWTADPDRVLTEAAALVVAGRSQPTRVPPVIDIDSSERVIVIGHAESGAHEWKTDLLAGRVDFAVAARLGNILSRWHTETAGDAAVLERFGSTAAFDQLRIDPFHRTIARRHPDLAPVIDAVVDRMLASPTCLVHGDFSPKNILLGPSATWVIDWEVAHYGDPTFDLGFLLAHLLCKTLHRPVSADDYRTAASTFLSHYRAGADDRERSWDERQVTGQTACLLLARVDGKSPAPYLDADARDRGRDLARTVLADGHATLDELWRTLL